MTLWISSELHAELEQGRADYEMRCLHTAALLDDKLRTKRQRRERSGAIRRAWTLERERQEQSVRAFWLDLLAVNSPAWATIGRTRFTLTR